MYIVCYNVLHFTTTMMTNLVMNLYLLVVVDRLRATTTTAREYAYLGLGGGKC